MGQNSQMKSINKIRYLALVQTLFFFNCFINQTKLLEPKEKINKVSNIMNLLFIRRNTNYSKPLPKPM